MTEPRIQAPPSIASVSPVAQVRAYHQRSKHQLQRYAAGPESLDWDAQPDPFRHWLGSELTALPLVADELTACWADLWRPGAIAPQPLSLTSLAGLLELSFGLAAWKQHGPDRWAVRCTPSSGNLHPTEAWLLTSGVPGLRAGLYHYAPREHGLELRAAFNAPAHPTAQAPRAFIALSSIHWREAWKYGERAFRYCQLDIGHALGALRYAAALQGWRLVTHLLGSADLAHRLGLDREADFGPAEREDAELLVELRPNDGGDADPATAPAPDWTATAAWFGQASRLDRHPMYRWPVIAEVARASAVPAPGVWTLADTLRDEAPVGDGELLPSSTTPATTPATSPAPAPTEADNSGTDRHTEPAARLIRERRSAQRFDARARVPLQRLLPLLSALASHRLPLDGPTARAARVHPIVFAHRVDGLAPGAYLLPRRPEAEALLRRRLNPALEWSPVALPPPASGLRMLRLAENTALPGTLRTLNCHQALGSDAVMAFALLGEFDALLGSESPHASQPPAAWHYRHLFHEAGLLGQVLYMEAEAAGLAGTGIGCYFDDGLHQLIGLADTSFQSVYHFTVGQRLADGRILTEPPYAHRGDASAACPFDRIIGPTDR